MENLKEQVERTRGWCRPKGTNPYSMKKDQRAGPSYASSQLTS